MWCVLLCRSVQYIDRCATEEFHTLSRYPNELQKKITLLNYFRSYMSEHLLKVRACVCVCRLGCLRGWGGGLCHLPSPPERRREARLVSGRWRRGCACHTSGHGSGHAQPSSSTSPTGPSRYVTPHVQWHSSVRSTPLECPSVCVLRSTSSKTTPRSLSVP